MNRTTIKQIASLPLAMTVINLHIASAKKPHNDGSYKQITSLLSKYLNDNQIKPFVFKIKNHSIFMLYLR